MSQSLREDPEKLPKVIANSIGMKLALIPAGAFFMGTPRSRKGGRDNIRHQVRINKPFYLGVYEVTQEEYEQVMRKNPSAFRTVQGLDTKRFPVEMTTWNDAVEFCRKLSAKSQEHQVGRRYRLPTEAEWEYACRAGTATTFCFGDSLSSRQANFDGFLPYGGAARGPNLQRPAPVGSYQANAFGLYDMHGNIYEWCADGYASDYYEKSPVDDPLGPSMAYEYPPGSQGAKVKVLRGGGWNGIARLCRSADRYYDSRMRCYNDYGFRVAIST